MTRASAARLFVSFLLTEEGQKILNEHTASPVNTPGTGGLPEGAELLLAKHRNGATGVEKLAFQKRYAKFADLAAGA